MEIKQAKLKAVFMPQTMGIFILLIIALSFAAGTVRREMVLTLTGSVFLAIWIYCLVMTLALAIIHRRRAGKISIRFSPEKIICTEQTQVIFSESRLSSGTQPAGKFFQLPGILIRCRVIISTKDSRRLTYDFKPDSVQPHFFADRRGAYYSSYDEFAIFDILGFFRFTFRIPVLLSAARLLVGPQVSSDPIPIRAKGGKSERQEIHVYERTDNLVDHRPYVPGDDPRRINWKLFSHGGELFIRQGEPQPPPFSNITMFIDTQYDSLYTLKTAADAVDLLCENALAIVNNTGKEKNIQIGFTGQSIKNSSLLTQAELGFFLAYPSAWGHDTIVDLPALPAEDSGILILALPRVAAQSSALDRFLANNTGRTSGTIELIFIFGSKDRVTYDNMAAAAETCVSFYNKRGVRTRMIGVS